MPRQAIDFILVSALKLVGSATVLALLAIVVFTGLEAWPAWQNPGFLRFFTDQSWHPLSGQFGLMPMIVGTAATSTLALLAAAPLGIGAALFARFYAPSFLRRPFRIMIELLAGIPSVVYGLWGLVVLVPIIARFQPPGTSLLGAAIVLSVMIFPTIALLTLVALDNQKPSYEKAAAAVSLSCWTYIRAIALPVAAGGIRAGILLALARALGETMAVLMVAGNAVRVPNSIFDSVRTLTANIGLEMAYATDEHRAALFLSGLLVMALTLGLVLLCPRERGPHVNPR